MSNVTKKNNRTGLIAGYGIKPDNFEQEWYPYDEEIILSSKVGSLAPIRIFKVTENGKEEIVFGLVNLCKRLSYYPDKILNNKAYKEVLNKFSGIPNLSIRRLDSPIEN